MSEYQAFLEQKAQLGRGDGFAPLWLPDYLFDFQRDLVDWAIRRGRAAIFADCGLGKTPMQLVWAENVHRATQRPVLIVTPLAVSWQLLREAEKFGIPCVRVTTGTPPAGAGLVVTNYERLHLFNPQEVAGVVCDESSILKNYDGARRAIVTEFLRTQRYRLLCTATAAPNDYIELGTTSEALGELGYVDMLMRFFKNEQHTLNPLRNFGESGKWRLKHHAHAPFWRWVASWARAIRRPSDMGHADAQFILPPLEQVEHLIAARTRREGWLFDLPAVGLHEQRLERRRTIAERCEAIAALVAHREPALVWCHLNAESERLATLISDAEQMSGSDSDEEKEAKLLAFATGQLRVLVTKPKIGAWGLNLQHCAHVTFFPSHSYEQHYQGIRRCWRFGQTRPVRVDVVLTEGERAVMANLQRKAAQADRMFEVLIGHMHRALALPPRAEPTLAPEMPSWL